MNPPARNLAPALRRHLLHFATAALCLIVGLFLLTRLLGGDPVRASLGPTAPAELVAQRRAELHLDQPLPVQFALYVTALAKGDMGRSIATGEPVSATLAPRIANSAQLGSVALILVALAIPTGMAVGILVHGGRRAQLRRSFEVGTGLTTAIPEFLLAAGLISIFSVWLGLLPSAGRTDWRSFILPALAMGLGPAALLGRVVRTETHRVLDEAYMLTARSKYLPARLLYMRHAFPNLVAATLAISGLIASSLLGGAVLVENVFAWPGLGSSLVAAITVRDYPVVQGIGLLLGLGVLAINTSVDLCLALLHRRGG